jgi:hypothetical protein
MKKARKAKKEMAGRDARGETEAEPGLIEQFDLYRSSSDPALSVQRFNIGSEHYLAVNGNSSKGDSVFYKWEDGQLTEIYTEGESGCEESEDENDADFEWSFYERERAGESARRHAADQEKKRREYERESMLERQAQERTRREAEEQVKRRRRRGRREAEVRARQAQHLTRQDAEERVIVTGIQS